jgi:hypothetical protein
LIDQQVEIWEKHWMKIQIVGNEKWMIKLSIKTLDWAPKFHVLSKSKPKCQSHKEVLNTCSIGIGCLQDMVYMILGNIGIAYSITKITCKISLTLNSFKTQL